MSFIYPQLDCAGYLFINRLQIINANAISSPLTYGFPAITGFTGAVHALSRKISEIEGLDDCRLDGVLVACHDCTPQTYRENSDKNFSFIQTRNPIKKDGKTAPIIEEGRCHLTVSLVIGVYSTSILFADEQAKLLVDKVQKLICQQRLAGGSVMEIDGSEPVSFCDADKISELSSKLLPAFVLINAHDSLLEITQALQSKNPNATALDALIETATLHHIPPDEKGSSWTVETVKKGHGWLVPIPVGYQGISPKFDAGQMQDARSAVHPSQYVEAIYSLGKWVFPYSIDNLEDALWYQYHDDEQALYLVAHKNDF